jgi:hypothetical protein
MKSVHIPYPYSLILGTKKCKMPNIGLSPFQNFGRQWKLGSLPLWAKKKYIQVMGKLYFWIFLGSLTCICNNLVDSSSWQWNISHMELTIWCVDLMTHQTRLMCRVLFKRLGFTQIKPLYGGVEHGPEFGKA